MNKLTKNKIFFNLEKIISILTASAIIITTLVMITSCSQSRYAYNYNQKFLKQYSDNCPTFKNKHTNGLEF